MTIGRKITLGFTIPVLLLLATGVLARTISTRLVTATTWVEHSQEVTTTLEQVLIRIVDAETGGRAFFLVGDDAFLERYVAASSDANRLLDTAAKLTQDNPEQQRKIEAIRTSASARLGVLATAIERRRRAPFDDATVRQVLTDGKRAMDQLRADIDAALADETRLLAERKAEAVDTAGSAQTILLLAIVLGVALSLLSSVLIIRSITTPLAVVRAGVDRMTGGDLKHRLPTGGRDELGKLSVSFNEMVASRQRAEEEVAARAEQRERVLDRVGEIASRLAAAAEELQASTSSQASGAQQQSAAVAETTTIVEEVVQTSMQAAERAQVVAEVARKAAEAGEVGQESLGEATTTMQRAREQANRVAESILSLAEQAQSIEEIIVSVDDLAEQSNMLALNAALEASRAGEHGRGFAVVAAEIKVLADASKTATVQVRRILGTIQKQSNQAVMMTEASTRGIGEASKAAEAVVETMRTLGEAISTASQSVSQIAASARQQSGGLQQINQAMRDVSAVATQNLATTRQVGQAATDLTTLGTTLKQVFAETAAPRTNGPADGRA